MITEILTPNIEISWLPWAVAYFFFIGLSITAVILTLPGILFGQKHLLGVTRVAMFIMLICAIVGPVALLADLHQPARFWHFYAHITPWSWMSIGAIFLPLYVVATFLYSWLFLRPALLENKAKRGIAGSISRILGMGSWQGQYLLKPVAIITLILAMIIALYTGSEVAIVASRVLWNSYLIPVIFFITALLGASSASFIIAYLMGEDSFTLNRLSQYNRWISVTFLVFLLIWFILAATTSGTEANALTQLKDSVQWQLNLVVLIILSLFTAVFSTNTALKLNLLATMSGIGISWFFRWLIFIDGQAIPKYGAGFYRYELPMGAEGLLGMVGVFGLWLFLAIIVYELLPWKSIMNSQVQVQS